MVLLCEDEVIICVFVLCVKEVLWLGDVDDCDYVVKLGECVGVV